MILDRRALLKLMGLGAALAPHAGAAAFAGTHRPTFAVLLTGAGPDLTAGAMRAILEPFQRDSIPVAVALDPGDTEGDTPNRAAERAAFLARTAEERPALLELMPWLADLAGMKPYFQMRWTSRVVAAMKALPEEPAPALRKPVTIAARAGPERPSLNGVRIAGIRTVLLIPEEDSRAEVAACPGPVICATGGLRHRLGDAVTTLRRSLAAAGDAGGHVTLAIDLGKAVRDEGELARQAGEIAGLIRDEVARGRLSVLLPREIILRHDPDFRRLLALQIDPPGAADAGAAMALDALTTALRAAGIDHAVGPPRQSDSTGPALRLGRDPAGFNGMDGDGAHWLAPDLVIADSDDIAALDRLGPSADAYLLIREGAYRTPARRNALVAALREIALPPDRETLKPRRLAARIRPADPLFDLMTATRRDSAAASARPAPLSREAQEELLEDARLAWTYFKRLTNEKTGLCPSTAALIDGSVVAFPRLTMWDYGSLIFAVCAAREVGLIGADEFASRYGLLLASLPAVRIGDLTLPRSEISTNLPALGTTDFNACDTGRLLSALRSLRDAADTPDEVDAAVARWDLAKTIAGGRLRSYRRGRFSDATASHCASYAARAFGLWGLEARSPHDAMAGETETDARMNLLYGIAWFGALGAEPLLFEPVELGPTPASAYLADLLFAAQLRTFRETGRLICVSEGPLPEDPWFSYQGLQLDAARDPWQISTVVRDKRFETEEFRRENFMISSKAAFLWTAVHPHPYSRLLVEYVRGTARIDGLGFASGIYQQTGRPTENYTDINTNAVILQAVAHALRENRKQGAE